MSIQKLGKQVLFGFIAAAMIMLSGCASVNSVARCYSDTGMGTSCVYSEVKRQPSQVAPNGEHGMSAKAGQIQDFSGKFCIDDQKAEAGSFYLGSLFAACKSTKASCENKGGQIVLNAQNKGMCTVSLGR